MPSRKSPKLNPSKGKIAADSAKERRIRTIATLTTEVQEIANAYDASKEDRQKRDRQDYYKKNKGPTLTAPPKPRLTNDESKELNKERANKRYRDQKATIQAAQGTDDTLSPPTISSALLAIDNNRKASNKRYQTQLQARAAAQQARIENPSLPITKAELSIERNKKAANARAAAKRTEPDKKIF
jgi:hypothetical protein